MDNNLKAEIKEYLAQEQPEYFQGIELYAKCPKAKSNLIRSFNQRWKHQASHKRLIYEFEKILGVKEFSGRATVLKVRPASIPFKVIDETKEVAPKHYEYKIAYDALPEELKALVIEKGQLYNALDAKKKALADVGEVNDEKSVATRQRLLKSMRDTSDRIIKIHGLLIEFDATEEMKPEVFNKLEGEAKEKAQAKLDNFIKLALTFNTNKPVSGKTSEEKEETQETDELDQLYNYKAMGYHERKTFLNRLRSSVPKNEKTAKTSEKPDVVERNQAKAKSGRAMIAVLEQYFKDTPEPKPEQ